MCYTKCSITSHSTLYGSFRRQFLQVRWPNHQCRSTEGSQSCHVTPFMTKSSAIADNRPMPVHADLLDTKCYEAQLSMLYCQELPSGEWLRFIDLIFQLLPTLLPPSRCQVHIRYGKTRTAGLQSGERRTIINSVAWAQYTKHDIHTDSHSNCCDNALRRVAKTSQEMVGVYTYSPGADKQHETRR